MIDEKKLLCAFIYSAYESGSCSLEANQKEKNLHAFKNYIKNENHYPKEEIGMTKNKLLEKTKNGIRKYIYEDHYKLVKNQIEETIEKPLEELEKSGHVFWLAINCPINFYKVIENKGSELEVENIITKGTKTLEVLEGLENPRKGSIISGHWNHFLEIINEKKYIQLAKEYYEPLLK